MRALRDACNLSSIARAFALEADHACMHRTPLSSSKTVGLFLHHRSMGELYAPAVPKAKRSATAFVIQILRWRAGLTPIDVAINARHVAMVRKLETRAQFQAVLLMKVPKWGGLGTEWKQRCAAGSVPFARLCLPVRRLAASR